MRTIARLCLLAAATTAGAVLLPLDAPPAGAACGGMLFDVVPDAVRFVGTVEDSEFDESMSAAITTFRVEDWLVGDGEDTVQVVTNAQSAEMSDDEFVAIGDERPTVADGERWRMEAQDPGRSLGDPLDSACGESERLATAPPPSSGSWNWPVAGVVAVGLVAGGATVALRHRRAADVAA